MDSSVAITLCAHTSLGTQPIYLFGSEAAEAGVAATALRGRMPGRVRVDRAGGRQRRGQHAHARDDSATAGWTINGAKQFITNAGTDISGVVCITARTGDEPERDDPRRSATCWWPTARPATSRGSRIARWAGTPSDTRPLTFTDCKVPAENLLGPRGAGFKQFLHILDIGRIGVAAMGVGLAQGALDEALKYAKERRAFGKPISKFQAIQAKLADMVTEIEAARLLVYKAALEKDAGRNFTLTAAQAKLKTGRLAVRCAEEAVQIHGGYGYIEEYPVCRFYRDAKILTIGEGTDEVQQMVIARALGA